MSNPAAVEDSAFMTQMVVDVRRHGPFRGVLDPERLAAYALATRDLTPAVLAGAAVPAVFPAVLIFEAQEAANADVPADAWRQARGGLHGEHDIVLHRPLIPGEALATWSSISAVRTVPAGAQVVLHIEQLDENNRVAVEQWWTTVLLGVSTMADLGSPPADHRFPDAARGNLVGSALHDVDNQVAHRYAEVSDDWSSHHFDIDAARASGFDFLFTHGLYTMAVCAHRVLGIVGVDDPGRLSRVAVRFASPTPLGAGLTVNAYRINGNALAFEATSRDVTTITHGRLELRS